MDDETTSAPMQSTSFVDFLSGSFNADEIVHSRPTPRVINPAMKTALTTAGQAVAIGLGMGTAVFHAQNKKTTVKQSIQAKNGGFGSKNLENLEQRGAYSGVEVDHFEFAADHPDTELLAKTEDKAE